MSVDRRIRRHFRQSLDAKARIGGAATALSEFDKGYALLQRALRYTQVSQCIDGVVSKVMDVV